MRTLDRLAPSLACLALLVAMTAGCESDAPPAAVTMDEPLMADEAMGMDTAAQSPPAMAEPQEDPTPEAAAEAEVEPAMTEPAPATAPDPAPDPAPMAEADVNVDVATESDAPAAEPAPVVMAAPPAEAGEPSAPAVADPDAVPVLPLPQAAAQDGRLFEGVVLNREAGFIDLDATVCGRNVDWLELLACSPNSREHESIVTIPAKASHIQLALLLLGLEPGSPVWVERSDDGDLIVHPPTGPRVAVYFILPDEPDQLIAANTWVKDQENGEPLPDNQWLFTGSRFVEFEGEKWYLADENGTLISLVNFGDELMGRDTTQGDDGGNGLWTTFAERIPERGTKLTVRLIPVKDNP